MRISIHAPREGSDGESYLPTKHGTHFYPRSPRGERLPASFPSRLPMIISIHAPREGSDNERLIVQAMVSLISIHAPREGSDEKFDALPIAIKQFLSTLPARGAT